MTEASIPYWFVLMIIGLLTFFLIRFWYMVDEIRKDVKKMLISEAENKQIIANMREDVEEFKLRQHEYEKKINFLQREIERLKPKL